MFNHNEDFEIGEEEFELKQNRELFLMRMFQKAIWCQRKGKDLAFRVTDVFTASKTEIVILKFQGF